MERTISAARRKAVGLWKRTEGRLIAFTLVLVVMGVAAGLTGTVSIQSWAASLDDVAAQRSPVYAAALEIYRSLSDADAAIASSMLAGGDQSQILYERYLADVTQTARALNIAVRGVSAADRSAIADLNAKAAVAELSDRLPVYTGLVETARSYHRLGMPLGASYLRQASALVRNTMLPLARELYDRQAGRTRAEQAQASRTAWEALVLIGFALAALIAVQVYLGRRTKRLFNIGLVAATLAALGGLTWLIGSAAGVAAGVRAGEADGTTQIAAIAEVRIAGLQAHAAESMRLFARGSQAEFEEAYADTMPKLGEQGGLTKAKTAVSQRDTRDAIDAAETALIGWQAAHERMRALDDEGDYTAAVAMADELTRLAGDFDRSLDDAMRQASGRFDAASHQARVAVSGADVGVATLFGLCVLFASAGMWQRIAEYR